MLTEAVRRRPYQVILLDEIEKAHPDVLETFLARVRRGSPHRRPRPHGGLHQHRDPDDLQPRRRRERQRPGGARRLRRGTSRAGSELEQASDRRARDALAPELYNRIDEVLVFSPLGRDDVREIARGCSPASARPELGRGIELGWDREVLDLLLDQGGYDPSLGARPMKRTIARLVEAPLAELILRGQAERGKHVQLGVRGPELTLTVRALA